MSLATANGTKFAGITASATTSAITTTTGSGIYVYAVWTRLTTFSSISDSKGNTYVQIGSEIDDATLFSKSRVYYCANATGGSGHTFTFNLAASRGITLLVLEITTTNGLGVALDQQNQANDTATPFEAAITPTSQPQLLLSAFNGDSATIVTHDPTANGFALVSGCEETDADSFWASAIASKSIAATSSVTASWTSTGTGGDASRAAVFVAGFSEVAGGSGPLLGRAGIPMGIQLQL